MDAQKEMKEKERQRVEESKGKTNCNGKPTQNGVKEKSVIYANEYKMATGYISDEGLRNRVFIDNRGDFQE